MWEKVFEQSPIALAFWEKDLKSVRINKALAEMNGYPPEKYAGKIAIEDLPEITAESLEIMQRVMATGKSFVGYEINGATVAKPAVCRTWMVSYHPIFSGDNIEGVLASCEEITDQKAVEEENRRNLEELGYRETKYHSLIEAIATIVWSADADGKPLDDAVMWRETTGQTVSDVMNEGWKIAVHPDDVAKTAEKWTEAIATKKMFEVEYRLRTKDNLYRHFAVRGVPVSNEKGEVREWIGVLIDIEDQKRAELKLSEAALEREDLLHREKLARREAEQANRLKDDFLATLSHELRTPLTATLGWVKMLRARQLDESDTAHALETIERNTQVQRQLIEDLLDVSRIVTGKLRLEIRALQISPILKVAINGILPTAEIKEIDIIEEIPPTSAVVYADPHRIQQIISNLLSNAVKFTPKGGKVTVGLREFGNRIEIFVKDTGMGIKPELLVSIFERFRQADSSTTRKYGGLGLGLAIVRHLVEAHGGTISAASDGENKGAIFTIGMPLIGKNFVPELEPGKYHTGDLSKVKIASDTRLKGLNLLVVDDDPDNLDLLKLVLSRYGATVKTVGSAAEAMRQIELEPPHLLISDIGMPIEDGYQLISKVRALPRENGGQIPAIALTAFAKIEDRERALAAGFQKHITKPVDPLDLVQAIAAIAFAETN